MNSPPILKFSEVTTEASELYDTGLWDISFELKPGDLMLVLLERERERLPLADAVEALVAPEHGAVSFLGEDWQQMSADRAAANRGRIRRVFEDEGWITDLDVDQNVMLSELHHTNRRRSEIQDEASKFARMFGLPGLQRGRPATANRLDLRKAACIRALLGQSALIVLERPTRGVYVDVEAPLINGVQSARKHGAAVLWMTSEPPIWNNTGLRATMRAKMFGSQMHTMELES